MITVLEISFWVFIVIIFYSYLGYGILMSIITRSQTIMDAIPKPFNCKPQIFETQNPEDYLPSVSLIISASGESERTLKEKIENTFQLNYPKDRMEVIFAIAYDTASKEDSTLRVFYETFLKEPTESGFSGKEEELYIKFRKFENISKDENSLAELQVQLENSVFTSEGITENAKQMLDDFFGGEENEFKIKITKDIERKGKISQVNRTVKNAVGEILVFSDANSMFNRDAIKNLVKHFRNSAVGCVAGEKRVLTAEGSTSGEGEGLYWKYESFLKRLDSKLWTTVGAAGEIFAVRKFLWGDGVLESAIIEDFLLSMTIAQNGYRVIYEPNAYAEEEPTKEMSDEFVRRRRIAAGGFQSIVYLKPLMNIFKYRVLTFQYVSHRVLRWAVVPFLLPIVFVINIILISNIFFILMFAFQFCFYIFAIIGYVLERRGKKIKIFYFPYVLTLMNIAAYAGLKRYIKNEQKVTWERVKRN